MIFKVPSNPYYFMILWILKELQIFSLLHSLLSCSLCRKFQGGRCLSAVLLLSLPNTVRYGIVHSSSYSDVARPFLDLLAPISLKFMGLNLLPVYEDACRKFVEYSVVVRGTSF